MAEVMVQDLEQLVASMNQQGLSNRTDEAKTDRQDNGLRCDR